MKLNEAALLALGDPIALRVLREAVDEKAALLEVLVRAEPGDARMKEDLMTTWGLQTILFSTEGRECKTI